MCVFELIQNSKLAYFVLQQSKPVLIKYDENKILITPIKQHTCFVKLCPAHKSPRAITTLTSSDPY